HLLRQTCRDAIGIDSGVIQTLRLKEYVVAFTPGKSHDLVFDRWTVARTDARDLATINGRTMQICPDHRMRHGRGRGYPTRDLLVGDRGRQYAERLRLGVARIGL